MEGIAELIFKTNRSELQHCSKQLVVRRFVRFVRAADILRIRYTIYCDADNNGHDRL